MKINTLTNNVYKCGHCNMLHFHPKEAMFIHTCCNMAPRQLKVEELFDISITLKDRTLLNQLRIGI